MISEHVARRKSQFWVYFATFVMIFWPTFESWLKNLIFHNISSFEVSFCSTNLFKLRCTTNLSPNSDSGDNFRPSTTHPEVPKSQNGCLGAIWNFFEIRKTSRKSRVLGIKWHFWEWCKCLGVLRYSRLLFAHFVLRVAHL